MLHLNHCARLKPWSYRTAGDISSLLSGSRATLKQLCVTLVTKVLDASGLTALLCPPHSADNKPYFPLLTRKSLPLKLVCPILDNLTGAHCFPELSIFLNGTSELKQLQKGGAAAIWESCSLMHIDNLALILANGTKIDADLLNTLIQARWSSCLIAYR